MAKDLESGGSPSGIVMDFEKVPNPDARYFTTGIEIIVFYTILRM